MYMIYQVEYGDTIDIIASKSGTTGENIKKINGINSDNELIVGNLIIVPKSSDNMFEKYLVKQGDTIYYISRKYNIDPNTLLEINGINKNDYIYPNQEILVPMSGVSLYVTKQGDTVEQILGNLNINYDQFKNQNNNLYVLEDQLVAIKKESN